MQTGFSDRGTRDKLLHRTRSHVTSTIGHQADTGTDLGRTGDYHRHRILLLWSRSKHWAKTKTTDATADARWSVLWRSWMGRCSCGYGCPAGEWAVTAATLFRSLGFRWQNKTMTENLRVRLADTDIPLGPLDGRYRGYVADLVDHLSEAALNRNRVHVEVEWFIHLADGQVVPGLQRLTDAQRDGLRAIVTEFDEASISELAETEAITVHDVKAVEYFIANRLDALGLGHLGSLVHFACTSEDINNLSYALGVRDAITDVWLPAAQKMVDAIATTANTAVETPMLSRTHGQPATPTTLGKELAVFVHRLNRQLHRIANQQYMGKINGATGTYAAHVAAVPHANWPVIAQDFVEGLGLTFNPLTTQIENHDWMSELYDDVARFNQILHGFCVDVWSYISIGYFAQIPVEGATGSS